MKKLYATFTFLFIIYTFLQAQNVHQLSDCIVTYNVSVEDVKADPAIAKAMAGAVKTLYIKGTKSRSDLETSNFKQSTLFDSKTDSTVILRELGPNKYISYLNAAQRTDKNKKYLEIQFSNTSEKKTILGYDCVHVLAKLPSGASYSVYYAPAIIPANTEYEYQFKTLPGFVLEYESESDDGKVKVKYTATKISLTPVPVAKFDIPRNGYRVL